MQTQNDGKKGKEMPMNEITCKLACSYPPNVLPSLGNLFGPMGQCSGGALGECAYMCIAIKDVPMSSPNYPPPLAQWQ